MPIICNLQKYDSEIIERYEGISQIRNLENTSKTSSRKTSIIGHGPGRSNVVRRKSVAKGLQMESIVSQMTDKGIRKMFDECSEEFFMALEDELGEALFCPTNKPRRDLDISVIWTFACDFACG